MKNILSFDCGGTYIKYALITEEGTFLEKGKFPTDTTDREHFLKNLQEIYQHFRQQEQRIDAIGICTPGMVDPNRGYLHTGGSIECLNDTPMAEMLSRMCDGIPVAVENDAKAAARAELEAGSLKDCQSGIVLAIGTAIGGTVIVDRKILRGSHLFAGEMSYAYYTNDRMTGEVSQFLSADSLHTVWARRCGSQRMRELYREFTGETIDDAHGAELFVRLKAGDPDARRAVQICCHDFAMLIFNLQCTLDPERIAIGGGISSEEEYIRLLQEETENYAKVTLPGAPVPNVCACTYRNDANLLGAFYSVLERIDSGSQKSVREG